MPFVSRRAPLKLSPGEVEMLSALLHESGESHATLFPASLRPRVERCVNKGFAIGGGAGVGRFAGPGAAGRP